MHDHRAGFNIPLRAARLGATKLEKGPAQGRPLSHSPSPTLRTSIIIATAARTWRCIKWEAGRAKWRGQHPGTWDDRDAFGLQSRPAPGYYGAVRAVARKVPLPLPKPEGVSTRRLLCKELSSVRCRTDAT
jgi:hypothetical protein